MSLVDRAPWLTLNDELEEVLAGLEQLLTRPAWQADAACREHPEIDFFPLNGDDARPAQRVCSTCLVRDDCLAFATHDNSLNGVWGGTTEQLRGARASNSKPRSEFEYSQLQDAEWLRAQYVDAGASLNMLASEVGCSNTAVRAALARHGIPTRAGGRPKRAA